MLFDPMLISTLSTLLRLKQVPTLAITIILEIPGGYGFSLLTNRIEANGGVRRRGSKALGIGDSACD